MSGINKRRLKIAAWVALTFGIAAPLLYLLNIVFAVIEAALLRSSWHSEDLYDAFANDWRMVCVHWKDAA